MMGGSDGEPPKVYMWNLVAGSSQVATGHGY